MHTYFSREYFLESIEHMVDNAVYTSVYPRISLAPDQRFIAKGCYITRLSGDADGSLEAVTDWLIPGLSSGSKLSNDLTIQRVNGMSF